MAFVGLFSCSPNPVLDKDMPRSETKREDGELEDGKIDEGVKIKEKNIIVEFKTLHKCSEKVKVQENNHLHQRTVKRHKIIKEKRRSKQSQRDIKKHHLASSDSSSDSYNSDHDHQDKHKNKKGKAFYRDYDGQFAQHDQEQLPRLMQNMSEKYDYEAEHADFNKLLSRYKLGKEVTASSQGKLTDQKNHANKSCLKGQQFHSLHGQGHVGGCGDLSRGFLTKNKKMKCKNLSRGRGRRLTLEDGQGGTKMKARSQPSVQKNRPVMSQEFINQHSFEYNGRNICKYFFEGRCIKGDLCKFEHGNVVPEKKKELCKFYVQGSCTKGESCIYMHNEYPCKFFHTGTKCYQGDYCKFSHDPLTDVTKELLNKVLKTDHEHTSDFKQDLDDPEKQGIFVLGYPPLGVGLLPTSESPQDGSKNVTSLFDNKVEVTLGLSKKIAVKPNFYNSASPPMEKFQESSAQFSSSTEDTKAENLCLLPPQQGPKIRPQPVGFGLSTPMSLTQVSYRSTIHQGTSPQRNEQCVQVQPDSGMQMHSELFKNLFTIQSLGLSEGQSGSMQNFPQNQGNGREICSSMQHFLPAVQEGLLLHLNQNQQDCNFHGSHKQHSLTPTKNPKVDAANWCSSDEDGSSFLKTLKRQHSLVQIQHSVMHPRLNRKIALPANSYEKANLGQGILDNGRDDETFIDPIPGREPYKTKHVSLSKLDSHSLHSISSVTQMPSATEEDDKEKWKLRDQTALIPLDCSLGVTLLDPRHHIKHFSHNRMDFFLQRPAFAHSVVWSPEDLIPLTITKQEHSINLSLPPLITDAQLNYRRLSLSYHTTSNTNLSTFSDVDRKNISTGMTMVHPVKPTNPLTHKVLYPRSNQLESFNSKKPANKISSPSLGMAETATSAKLDYEKVPSNVPNMASSTFYTKLASPTTLLGSVSLYDPRIHSLLSLNQETEKLERKTEMPKLSVKCESLRSLHVLSPLQVPSEKMANDSKKTLKIQTNGNPLDQLISTVMLDSTGAKEQDEKKEGEQEKFKNKRILLRDVFKTFDPTSSPFYQ